MLVFCFSFAPDDEDHDKDYGELPPTSEPLSTMPGFGASTMMGKLSGGHFGISNPVYEQFMDDEGDAVEEAGL